jgi:hypothetical protein
VLAIGVPFQLEQNRNVLSWHLGNATSTNLPSEFPCPLLAGNLLLQAIVFRFEAKVFSAFWRFWEEMGRCGVVDVLRAS